MNQILITGDEQITVKANTKKEKKVLPINGITRFYAIFTIILGICMVSGSFYAMNGINETVKAEIKPEITIERNDDNNTAIIKITHIRAIKSISYKWNEEEEILKDGINKKEVTEEIKLMGGSNTLKVTATEENGQTQTLEKTFIVANVPEIEKLEPVDNGVKIVVKSEDEIEYLQYSWDNGTMQKVDIRENKYEGIINAPKGKHTLRIEIVNVNGMKAEVTKDVIGDTEPKVDVVSKSIDGVRKFIIDAEDDEGITTISITHNNNEKQVINVNDKTYHKEVIMTEGEENTIIVTAININGIQKTRRIRVKDNM